MENSHKKPTIMALWEDVHRSFNSTDMDIFDKHMSFIMLEDLLIEISEYESDQIQKHTIRRVLGPFIDSYLYLIAEASTVTSFIFTFEALDKAIENQINKKVSEEKFESASNYLEIKNLLEKQKRKWIP